MYYDGCVHELVRLKVHQLHCLVKSFLYFLPFPEAAANHTTPFPPHSQKGAAFIHRESKDHCSAISASRYLTGELVSICTQSHLQKKRSPLPTLTRHFLYIFLLIFFHKFSFSISGFHSNHSTKITLDDMAHECPNWQMQKTLSAHFT